MKDIDFGSPVSSPRRSTGIAVSAVLLASTGAAYAIDGAPSPPTQAPAASSGADSKAVDSRISDLAQQVEELKRLVHVLQEQLPEQTPVPSATIADTPAKSTPTLSAPADTSGAPSTAASTSSKQGADFLRGLTINALLDTYYEYNTNSPIGRVNSLRAYDVKIGRAHV